MTSEISETSISIPGENKRGNYFPQSDIYFGTSRPLKSFELLKLNIGDKFDNDVYSDTFTYPNREYPEKVILEKVIVEKTGENEFKITEITSGHIKTATLILKLDSNDNDFGYYLLGKKGKISHLWTPRYKKPGKLETFTNFEGNYEDYDEQPLRKKRREESYLHGLENLLYRVGGIRKRKSKKNRKTFNKKNKKTYKKGLHKKIKRNKK